MLLAKMKLQ